ncbi:MAG: hypothetical protein LBI42_08900 [Chitinispirillales bacterium]|jgi:hypothetical protein|nr:hypothetical protein [Chitinispirillales bacterium]
MAFGNKISYIRHPRESGDPLSFSLKTTITKLCFVLLFLSSINFTVHAAKNDNTSVGDTITGLTKKAKSPACKPQTYSPSQDMAFVSVMGSRPNADFSGYRKAVLYNAKGALIQEIDISRSDSIYNLDKMIQENRTKGPLFIKMIRK